MFKIGQKVLVIDQKAPVEATILDIGQWSRSNPKAYLPGELACYRVGCPQWAPQERWISEMFLQELPAEEVKEPK